MLRRAVSGERERRLPLALGGRRLRKPSCPQVRRRPDRLVLAPRPVRPADFKDAEHCSGSSLPLVVVGPGAVPMARLVDECSRSARRVGGVSGR